MKSREVAKRAKVSEATIQRWKTGVNVPDIENLQVLAGIFKVEVAEFFKTEEAPKTFAETLIVSRLSDLLLRKISLIPDEIYELIEEAEMDDKGWETIAAAINGVKRRTRPNHHPGESRSK
jgi:transcriptional regulator with XRE-family HTH domain